MTFIISLMLSIIGKMEWTNRNHVYTVLCLGSIDPSPWRTEFIGIVIFPLNNNIIGNGNHYFWNWYYLLASITFTILEVMLLEIITESCYWLKVCNTHILAKIMRIIFPWTSLHISNARIYCKLYTCAMFYRQRKLILCKKSLVF